MMRRRCMMMLRAFITWTVMAPVEEIGLRMLVGIVFLSQSNLSS